MKQTKVTLFSVLHPRFETVRLPSINVKGYRESCRKPSSSKTPNWYLQKLFRSIEAAKKYNVSALQNQFFVAQRTLLGKYSKSYSKQRKQKWIWNFKTNKNMLCRDFISILRWYNFNSPSFLADFGWRSKVILFPPPPPHFIS